MSDHGAQHSATPVANPGEASPEFDQVEVKFFGKEDTVATTAISRMLVIFFIYSLAIMAGVVFVLRSHWLEAPTADTQAPPHEKHTAPF